MSNTNSSKGMNKNATKILRDLMESELAEAFTLLALHLRSRERTARVTDVSQMLSTMKTQFKKDVPHEALIKILMTLEETGVGKLKSESGRRKFVWNYWIFPMMDLKTNILRDFTFLPLEEFQNDKTRLRKIKDQIRENELRRAADGNSASLGEKNESTAINMAAALSSVSLEDLMNEIKKRGFQVSISLTDKKPS